ncbi:MAG: DUF1990 domain-containing protein [Brevibacterium sp.]|nr:DUF1990 domain-containing protein [Brevibacterium sp.]MDN6528725.1 DUF1990 domain-containing protein [Brevibacterium sp.]
MSRSLDEPLTQPLSPRWLDRPAGYRDFESAFFVGHGRATFDRCAEELLHWQVKIRSGFDIGVQAQRDEADPPGTGQRASEGAGSEPGAKPVAEPGTGAGSGADAGTGANTGSGTGSNTGSGAPRVRAGQEPTIFVRLGPFRLPEPARVIEVFESETRRGFTYGTKPGHPITGEESFILIHTPDDRVFLVLRSLSRAGMGIWRLGEPFVRLAQIIYRRRYSRALHE